MFKGHPKGLIPASLANMGERFGFYTMMAILVLFLQAKFGLDGKDAGLIYSVFYFSIYILAFVGGIIADKMQNFKGIILTGLIIMATGYVMLAYPTGPADKPIPADNILFYLIYTCAALFIIAFGNGLFKGNLQALVGQMYDKKAYTEKRDSGFSLFYMFINVGAIFAPFTAVGIRNWWLSRHGFEYNANLPSLCHQSINGTLQSSQVVGTGALDKAQALAEQTFSLDPINKFNELATSVSTSTQDLTTFASEYLKVFNTGFHYAFAAAIGAMVISLIIYLVNLKKFPSIQKKAKVEDTKQDTENVVEMSAAEIKQRLYALLAVFGVVIFFWFSFHQNGLTLTMFARDYTDLSGIKIDIGSISIVGAEIFQSINPIFIVLLTPIIMAVFGWLNSRGMEPSTPKKIAIGMGIAALAYVLMSFGSFSLPSFSEIDGSPLADAEKVTPFLLIGTYFILTVAELFISPLGISFVSKVAPPQYQGIMQGGWLGATALGNQLLFIGAILYESIPLWITWSVFITACLLSMFTMLFMLKWLEKITK